MLVDSKPKRVHSVLAGSPTATTRPCVDQGEVHGNEIELNQRNLASRQATYDLNPSFREHDSSHPVLAQNRARKAIRMSAVKNRCTIR